ncbi:MAG: hypothetical protein ABI907_04320 [Ramlibacter sp.]
MRIFGVLSLLITLVIVGLLAKKQLASGVAPPVLPALPGASAASASAPPATPQQQVQQFKKAVESQMQQARPTGDDEK